MNSPAHHPSSLVVGYNGVGAELSGLTPPRVSAAPSPGSMPSRAPRHDGLKAPRLPLLVAMHPRFLGRWSRSPVVGAHSQDEQTATHP